MSQRLPYKESGLLSASWQHPCSTQNWNTGLLYPTRDNNFRTVCFSAFSKHNPLWSLLNELFGWWGYFSVGLWKDQIFLMSLVYELRFSSDETAVWEVRKGKELLSIPTMDKGPDTTRTTKFPNCSADAAHWGPWQRYLMWREGSGWKRDMI